MRNQLDSLIVVPLYVICCFSLLAVNVLSLSLVFVSLITVSWCVPLWVNPVWESLCFLGLGDCFLSQVREVFSYYVFKYVLKPLCSLFSLWDPYNANISVLDVVPVVS